MVFRGEKILNTATLKEMSFSCVANSQLFIMKIISNLAKRSRKYKTYREEQ